MREPETHRMSDWLVSYRPKESCGELCWTITCLRCSGDIEVPHGVIVQCGDPGQVHLISNYSNHMELWDSRSPTGASSGA